MGYQSSTTVSCFSSSYGNRTHLFALKGRNPKPIDERAVSARPVGREALESSSAAFQTAARPSQLPTQTKKPDVAVTPGFVKLRSVLGRAATAPRMPCTRSHRLTG